LEKKAILPFPISQNVIARCHLEKGAYCLRLSYSERLKTGTIAAQGAWGYPARVSGWEMARRAGCGEEKGLIWIC
jgi:hypothetical protein